MFSIPKLLAALLIISHTKASKDYCKFTPVNNQLLCSEFKSPTDLDFTSFTDPIQTLTIKADRSNNNTINNSLNFSTLNFKPEPSIKLQNFRSIDPAAAALRNSIPLNAKLELRYTDWLFTSDFNCSNTQLDLIFSNLTLNEFFWNDAVFLQASPLCPVLFKGMKAKRLRISSAYRMSFIEKNSTDCGIEIDELVIQNTYSDFITELSQEEILFPAMFERLKSIEINKVIFVLIDFKGRVSVYVTRIDAASLSSLTDLKSLTLRQLDLETLLQSSHDWLSSLNSQNKKNLSDPDLTQSDFFFLAFGIGAESRLNMEFNDEQICLFKDFPHENLIVPVFYEEFQTLGNSLACSCTINWLFKDYKVFREYLQLKDEFKFPQHCLDIHSSLLSEQTAFCSNPTRLESCNQATSDQLSLSTPATNIANKTVCFTSCSCAIQDSVKVLECSDPFVNEVPDGLESADAWSYVSFVGSGLKSLRTFKGLRLVEHASLVVSDIEFFDDYLFKDTNYTSSFRFVIQNSSLESLAMKSPFQRTNFTELDFNGCSLGTWIVVSGFIDSNINTLTIRNPSEGSRNPMFRRGSLIGDINIKRFRILNAFGTFSRNSPTGFFAIDQLLMNYFMFKELEELEITNTVIDFIEPSSLLPLGKLKILRLENVGLKSIMLAYFDRFKPMGGIEFENEKFSLMANGKLKEIYLGHEDNETWLDIEVICYFAGLNVKEESTTVFIYDTLDYINGIECTCTVYWIYTRTNLEALANAEYVPECIKRLNSTENVQRVFEYECLPTIGDPELFCKTFPVTMATSTAEVTDRESTIVEVVEPSIYSTEDSNVISTLGPQEAEFDYEKSLEKIKILVIVLLGLVGLIIIGFIFKTFISICKAKSKFATTESIEMNF